MKRILSKWLATAVLVAILSLLVFFRWQIATVKIFDADEMNHLHAAWLMANGALPYRDFYVGYPPTFYLLLTPFTFFLPPSDFLPVLLRQVFFFIFLLTLLLFYKLARLALSREFSLIAMILLTTSVFFIEKGVEIRVDLLVILLWLLSAYLLITKHPRFFWAGLSSGLMASLTQKSIYGVAAVGFLALFVCWKSTTNKVLPRRTVSFIKTFSRFLLAAAIVPFGLLLYAANNDLIRYLPDYLVRYPLLLASNYQWDHPWYHLGFINNFTSYTYFYYFYKGSLLWLRVTQIVWVAAILFTSFWVLKHLIKIRSLTAQRVKFLFVLTPGLFFSVAYLLTISMKIPQYWLIPTPFVVLSLAFGLSELASLSKYLKRALLIAIILGFLPLTTELQRAWDGDIKNKNNFRQLSDISAVLNFTKPTFLIVATNGYKIQTCTRIIVTLQSDRPAMMDSWIVRHRIDFP